MKLQFLTVCLLLSFGMVYTAPIIIDGNDGLGGDCIHYHHPYTTDEAILLKYQTQLNNSVQSSKREKINIILAMLQDDKFCDDFDIHVHNRGSFARSSEIYNDVTPLYCCCKFYIKDQVVQDHIIELKTFVDSKLSKLQKN